MYKLKQEYLIYATCKNHEAELLAGNVEIETFSIEIPPHALKKIYRELADKLFIEYGVDISDKVEEYICQTIQS